MGMILEIVFILGLVTGLMAALILYLIFYREDDFEKRQEKYKRMI